MQNYGTKGRGISIMLEFYSFKSVERNFCMSFSSISIHSNDTLFLLHFSFIPPLLCFFLFNFYPFYFFFSSKQSLKAHYNETDILIDPVWNINHSFIQNCCIKARKIQQKYTSITLSGPWLRQHIYLIIVNLNSHCIIRLRVVVQIYVDTLSKITFVRRKKLLLSFQTEFWLLPMEKQTHTTISLLQQQIWAPKPAC